MDSFVEIDGVFSCDGFLFLLGHFCFYDFLTRMLIQLATKGRMDDDDFRDQKCFTLTPKLKNQEILSILNINNLSKCDSICVIKKWGNILSFSEWMVNLQPITWLTQKNNTKRKKITKADWENALQRFDHFLKRKEEHIKVESLKKQEEEVRSSRNRINPADSGAAEVYPSKASFCSLYCRKVKRMGSWFCMSNQIRMRSAYNGWGSLNLWKILKWSPRYNTCLNHILMTEANKSALRISVY